jgi:hypothetical protein
LLPQFFARTHLPAVTVRAYLGRYTHRAAIANSRLVRADDTSVTFR